MKKPFLVFLLLIGVNYLYSQRIPESEFSMRMDKGENLMKQGRYKEAQEEFLFVIANKEVLPANLAYFFGRNSYYLEEYKQSINWLNKYIQLKGTQGSYYKEAVAFLELSEEEFVKQQRVNSENVSNELKNEEYDCGGLEKMICPVCKGSGVLIKKGPINNIYSTCPYCSGDSYLSCEEYNLFMRGKLEPKID